MNPTETKTTIFITIEKPIYGTYVGIRDKWIKRAKETKKTLTIKCGQYKATVAPQDWVRGAKKIKREFLIPNEPMTLYCNHLTKYIKKDEPEWNDEGLKMMRNALKVALKR